MKKKYIILSMSMLAGLGIISSCSEDFLKEELITKDSTQSFETQEGLDKLAIGMYKTFEFHFNYEWAYCLTNYGTDEMSVANDDIKAMWNNYNQSLNSANTGELAPIWDNMYGGISSANLLISNVPKFYDRSSANYNTRLGEGYFVRGFNYFVLVNQFGGVPLVQDVISGPQTDFASHTAEEVYALIVSDLKNAYDLLPTTVSETGD